MKEIPKIEMTLLKNSKHYLIIRVNWQMQNGELKHSSKEENTLQTN